MRHLRSALSVFPRIHSACVPKKAKLPQSVTLFFYGGFGDTIMKLASISHLPESIEIQLIASKKHAPLLDLVAGENIQRYVIDSIGSLFAMRSRINKKSLFVFQSPLFEIYLIFLVLGLKQGFGFVGNRAALRGIGFKPGMAISTDVSVNDHRNYCNMIAVYNLSESQRFTLKGKDFVVGIKDFVIININKSQGWPAGRWSIDKFFEVAQFVANELGFGIVLVGSQGEKEQVDAFEKKLRSSGLEQISNAAGRTSFAELIDLVAKAKFVITCDAFVMHLASYFDKLTFSLFSFSDPNEFVWGKNTFSFNAKYECMPCVSFTTNPVDNAPFNCPYNARCDHTVTAPQLISTIRNTLKESRV